MEIKTKLGGVALAIVATPKADMAGKLAEIAAASLVYRAGGSKLFGAKSGHTTDDAYSTKLAEDAEAAVKLVFAPYFEGISIVSTPRVKVEGAVAKAKRELWEAAKDAGIAEDILRKLHPEQYAPAVEAAPAAVEAEVAVG